VVPHYERTCAFRNLWISVVGRLRTRTEAGHSRRYVPEVTGKDAALIVDDDEIAFHLPPDDRWRLASKAGRSFSYQVYEDGNLRLFGSSNDSYFLFLVMDCRWRWDGSTISCRRDDGGTMIFARDTAEGPRPPASQEQHVWLAASQHVLADESASVENPGPLPILSRTSYPASRLALSRLEDQTRNVLCDLSGKDTKEMLTALRWENKRHRPVREVFEYRPEFKLVDSRPEEGDHLGLSRVVFARDTEFAYLNVDIGGQSGSIVRMEKKDGAWAWSAECATWTNY
jgi:hypothetical protein